MGRPPCLLMGCIMQVHLSSLKFVVAGCATVVVLGAAGSAQAQFAGVMRDLSRVVEPVTQVSGALGRAAGKARTVERSVGRALDTVGVRDVSDLVDLGSLPQRAASRVATRAVESGIERVTGGLLGGVFGR